LNRTNDLTRRAWAAMGYDETVRKSTALAVASLRHLAHSWDDIRTAVPEAAWLAFDPESPGDEPAEALLLAGLFRLVLDGLGVDRGHWHARELFHAAVSDAVGPAISEARARIASL